jgi:hypothetical protein
VAAGRLLTTVRNAKDASAGGDVDVDADVDADVGVDADADAGVGVDAGGHAGSRTGAGAGRSVALNLQRRVPSRAAV